MSASCSCAAGSGTDPSQLPLGRRRGHRRGAPRRRPRRPPRRRRRRPAARGAGPRASGPARQQAASPDTPPTPAGTVAAFAIAGRLFVAGVVSARPRELPSPARFRSPPRPARPPCRLRLAAGCCASPSSTDVARPRRRRRRAGHGVVGQRRLHRRRGDAPLPRLLVEPRRIGDRGDAGRHRTGRAGWIADPADPSAPPRDVRYPSAGTPNADVSLHVIGLDGSVVDVEWDRGGSRTSPTCMVRRRADRRRSQSRDPAGVEVLDVDPPPARRVAVRRQRRSLGRARRRRCRD